MTYTSTTDIILEDKVINEYKALIIEDHNVVRAGIKFLLENITNCKFYTNEADSVEQAIEKVEQYSYDIILLDIELNGSNGIDFLQYIKASKPDTKVIVLTMYNDIITINKALDNGANGYILKNLIDEEIYLAIKTVLKGNQYICNEVSQTLLKEKINYSKGVLSKREIEVVKHIALGLSNVEAGKKLGLSYRTIDTHKQNIYAKLGINKNIELVKYAIKNNII